MPRHAAVLTSEEAVRQRADHLPAAGVPERDRVEHRAGAERGDEAVDLRDLDQHAVEEADDGAEPGPPARPRPARAGRTWICRLIARMCQSTMPKPTVRSILPVIIGIIAASDSSAMIALSARIERRLSKVGKVSRQQQREEQDRAARSGSTGRRPAASRAMPLAAATAPRSSARVGSSAFERDASSSRAPPCARPAVRRRPRRRCRIASTDSSSPASSADDPAAVEDQRAVADVGDLLEIGGDHDDGEPALERARRAAR